MKTLYLIMLVFLFSQCSSVIFDPISCDKFNDCRETIRKVYSLQKPSKAPRDIEVTNQYIALDKDIDIHHHITGATTTHSSKNTVYFKDIINLEIIHKFSRYEIRFINHANRVGTIIFLYDKEYAIQGYSALKCMIDAAKSKPGDKI